jgi:TRAP-type C4-dicarboxylate transport system permease small subunit
MSTDATVAAIVGVVRRVNRGFASAAGVAILLMMLAGALDVISTNFNLIGLDSRPVSSTNEFMATMMVAAVFLGMPLAQQRRAHIQVTVAHLVESRFLRPIEALRHLLHGLFYALIGWFGWSVAAHSVTTGEFAAGLVDFPVWPARLALAVGATAMTLQCLVDLIGVFDARFRVPDDRADAPISH